MFAVETLVTSEKPVNISLIPSYKYLQHFLWDVTDTFHCISLLGDEKC
jgi:hypothetical protein